MASVDYLLDVLAGQLADVEAGWSVGTFGVIAEFTRNAGEPAEIHRTRDKIGITTDRGSLCIGAVPELRLIASESLTAEAWSHRVALCLPQQSCAMNQRTRLTEVGPDVDAMRPRDRGHGLLNFKLRVSAA